SGEDSEDEGGRHGGFGDCQGSQDRPRVSLSRTGKLRMLGTSPVRFRRPREGTKFPENECFLYPVVRRSCSCIDRPTCSDRRNVRYASSPYGASVADICEQRKSVWPTLYA